MQVEGPSEGFNVNIVPNKLHEVWTSEVLDAAEQAAGAMLRRKYKYTGEPYINSFSRAVGYAIGGMEVNSGFVQTVIATIAISGAQYFEAEGTHNQKPGISENDTALSIFRKIQDRYKPGQFDDPKEEDKIQIDAQALSSTQLNQVVADFSHYKRQTMRLVLDCVGQRLSSMPDGVQKHALVGQALIIAAVTYAILLDHKPFGGHGLYGVGVPRIPRFPSLLGEQEQQIPEDSSE